MVDFISNNNMDMYCDNYMSCALYNENQNFLK